MDWVEALDGFVLYNDLVLNQHVNLKASIKLPVAVHDRKTDGTPDFQAVVV